MYLILSITALLISFLAYKINNKNVKLLIIVDIIISTIYILWRGTVIPTNLGIVSFILGLILFVCEFIGFMNFMNFQFILFGKYKIISQEEAYDKIKAGQFNSYELYNIKSILIRSIKLCYQLDSKGYYQPVYRFECTIDGEGRPIFIPALEEIK